MILLAAAANFADVPGFSVVLAERHLWIRLGAAVAVPTAFALLAVKLRAVTVGGAIAGAVTAFSIFLFTGPAGFLALATVFALTTAATRIGYSRKQSLGMAENTGGRRAGQVLANLAVAAVASVGGISEQHSWLVACMVAALAEAAADTVSSECGQAWSDRVYLITSFRRVPVGTDGGISVAGTACGIIAAAIVAWISYVLRLVPYHWAVVAGGAGVLGTFVDSLLGAAFERRLWLGNNTVNLLSTAAAAGLAALFLL